MIRIFTISLLLALCACTDQQTELGDASRALRFGVESIEDTKGSIINTSNITSMSVFCAHTGKEQYSSTATSNWMHNAVVTRTTENPEWTVQGDGVNKQWKDDGYHSFFAFAPHAPKGAVVSGLEKPGPPTLTYTVPVDYTKQVDLLYSHTTLINGKQMYIGSRPVVFGFRHALAKITFDARKEDIVTDEVTITNIRLSSIINKARYEFMMNEGDTDVAGISCVTESTDRSDFSITPNQTLGSTSALLLPADSALFMINQSFTANNKLIVTYNKGNEKGKTITADLSEVTAGGWDISKAYRYSILVKEDKVTITAEIQPWDKQEVDVAVPGTYLNVAQLSLSLPQGTGGDIYYSTDGSPVTATCDNPIIQFEPQDITPTKITFPSSAPYGNYIVTVSAGKLKREVKVEVTPYIQIGDLLWATGNLVADGPNKCKIGQPHDGGLYFQRWSLIGWTGGANGDGTGQPSGTPNLKIEVKPETYVGSSSWNKDWSGSITLNEKEGKGDPCEYYLGDGWRLPKSSEWGIGNGLSISEKPTNCVIGKYMYESEDKPNPRIWFENAGHRYYENGNLEYNTNTNGWSAYYWTMAEGVQGPNAWSMTSAATTNVSLRISYGTPIRCVKPVGTEPGDNDFIVEDGVAAPRIFVQGTGDDAKLMLTKNPLNHGALFQFGGVTAWEYDNNNPLFSITGKVQWNKDWISDAVHNVDNLGADKGDPCRLVGLSKAEIIVILNKLQIPDNGKWKMPDFNYSDPDFPIEPLFRPGWTVIGVVDEHYVNGHYFASQNSNFLPASGIRYKEYSERNSAGWYWTLTKSDQEYNGKGLHFTSGNISSADNSMSHGMSVRCVRQ